MSNSIEVGLNSKWTRKTLALSRVQPVYLSYPTLLNYPDLIVLSMKIITPLMGRLHCSTVRVCLDLMVAWAHKYINEAIYALSTHNDMSHHATFYSVCQAIFYIITFRHKELLGTKEGQLTSQNAPVYLFS